MAFVVADRVKETATVTGTTSPISLSGAASGYQSFSAGIGNGNECPYFIEDPITGDWEVTTGTYTASGSTLTRAATPLSSSNAGSKVNFAGNVCNVVCGFPADYAYLPPNFTEDNVLIVDANGNISQNASGYLKYDETHLYVGGAANPGIQIAEAGSATSYVRLCDEDTQYGNLMKVCASGVATLDLDAIPANGTSGSSIRFGANSTTTGNIQYIFFNGSGSPVHLLGTGSSVNYLCATGGSIIVGSSSVTPDSKLHVHKASAGTVTAHSSTVITAESNGNCFITLLSPSANSSGIYFGDPTSNNQGQLYYDHSVDDLIIRVGSTYFYNLSSVGMRIAGNSAEADAKLHTVVYTTEAIPCLELEQNDLDQPFIEFDGDSGTDLSNPATTRISGAVPKRFVRVSQNGTTFWTPLYSNPLSTDDCDPKGADPFCMGRLTLTSGTPYPVSDVTASSTVYFTPIGAGIIHLYDSTEGRWLPRKFTQASLSLSGMTVGYGQDVFAYWNSGSLALERVEWASATARATALGTQNGVYVKSGSPERLYVGSFRAQSATSTDFTKARRMVWNMYNRRRYPLKQLNAGGSATMSTTGYRGMGNTTANVIVEVFCGLQEGTVSLIATNNIENASGGNNAGWIGIAEDGLSPHGDCALGRWHTNDRANFLAPGRPAFLNTVPSSLGWHYYLGVESQDLASPTITHSNGYLNGSWEC